MPVLDQLGDSLRASREAVVCGVAPLGKDAPMRGNPKGKRLCGRATSLLVAKVEQPHLTPRALPPIPHRPLRGHAEY